MIWIPVIVVLQHFILFRMYFAGHLDGGADNVGTTSSGNTDKSSDTAGTLIFAGFSLANMYANVTGFAFLTGMSSAVDTLASQHNGAKCYEVRHAVHQANKVTRITSGTPFA